MFTKQKNYSFTVFALIISFIFIFHFSGLIKANETNDPITRGEFSVSVAKKMQLLPINKSLFPDLEDYEDHPYINTLIEKDIIGGYPDNTFKPEKTITRAEAIKTVIRALGIKESEKIINLEDFSSFNFEDISENHWGYKEIAIAQKLGLLDFISGNNFKPEKEMSFSEAKEILSDLENLTSFEGYLSDVYPSSKRLSFNTNQGERKILNYGEDSIIGRNNRIVDINDIQLTDESFVITNQDNNIVYLKAYGMITTQDLSTEVSRMTYDFLEPHEVETLATGNLNFLEPKLKNEIRDTMINQGLTENEANAIINTEWEKLEELSKTRFTEAVAIQTGLPLEITRSLFERDWEKIKNYGHVELFQRVVQEILKGDLIS
ncbi:MAG: S-layer homology domain-containing protein [Bacillota bacterium]